MSTQGNSVISSPQVLILDAAPPASEATLATRDVLSEQTLLGPGDEKFAVREGQITVGTPLLYALKAPTADGARLRPLPGAGPSSFYLVVFRFSLQPAPGERRYQAMNFKVALSDPESRAFKLLPERVVSEADIKEGYDIGFTLSLPGDKEKSPVALDVTGKATQTIAFTRLVPEITAFGIGESRFFWTFTGHSDMPLAPGSRTTAAVIQVPQGTKRLIATIAWQVDLERSRFEQWFKVPTKIDDLPIDLPLL